MAIQVEALERTFEYNGVVLPDPGVGLSVLQVKETYSMIYPELISAEIDAPVQSNGKLIYKFRRAVGSKG